MPILTFQACVFQTPSIFCSLSLWPWASGRQWRQCARSLAPSSPALGSWLRPAPNRLPSIPIGGFGEVGEEDHLNASSLPHSPSSFASSHTLTGGPNVEVMVRWYLFIFFFVCGLAQFKVCSTGSREKTAHATRIIGLRGFFSLVGLIYGMTFLSAFQQMGLCCLQCLPVPGFHFAPAQL